MIKYQVRSRDLIDMVNDIRSGRLILSPYFQRNLVWRDVHKRDFIETILKGYPFPQIFIARGDIDVDAMTTTSCIVDGQQRMNAIKEFVSDEFDVGGQAFTTLNADEKEQFLKYQIPVIDLDMRSDDDRIIDIFRRLNRTFYALSTIERMATEYATVDIMLIAKHLCHLLEREIELEEAPQNIIFDPNMPPGFLEWARTKNVERYREFVLSERIFTNYETSRMVHLMFTLNIISTVINGIFPRNERTKALLEEPYDTLPHRDLIIQRVNAVADKYLRVGFAKNSYWWNKANAFTLFVIMFWHYEYLKDISGTDLKQTLERFAAAPEEPYALAAKEAVNNRRERQLRHKMLCKVLGVDDGEKPLLG